MSTAKLIVNEPEHSALPRFERLQVACEFAARHFGNDILKAELREAADYFKGLTEDDTGKSEPRPVNWRRIGKKRFAICSEDLQMTEEGLRIAMYQIPKSEREGLLTFRWTRRYRDGAGKQWLEFEAS